MIRSGGFPCASGQEARPRTAELNPADPTPPPCSLPSCHPPLLSLWIPLPLQVGHEECRQRDLCDDQRNHLRNEQTLTTNVSLFQPASGPKPRSRPLACRQQFSKVQPHPGLSLLEKLTAGATSSRLLEDNGFLLSCEAGQSFYSAPPGPDPGTFTPFCPFWQKLWFFVFPPRHLSRGWGRSTPGMSD